MSKLGELFIKYDAVEFIEKEAFSLPGIKAGLNLTKFPKSIKLFGKTRFQKPMHSIRDFLAKTIRMERKHIGPTVARHLTRHGEVFPLYAAGSLYPLPLGTPALAMPALYSKAARKTTIGAGKDIFKFYKKGLGNAGKSWQSASQRIGSFGVPYDIGF